MHIFRPSTCIYHPRLEAWKSERLSLRFDIAYAQSLLEPGVQGNNDLDNIETGNRRKSQRYRKDKRQLKV